MSAQTTALKPTTRQRQSDQNAKSASPAPDEFIEVRCPFRATTKRGMTYICSRLCVKVSPGSSGEAFCSSCKLTFEFEIRQDDSVTHRVRVKK